ncbi:MAG: TetR/AcrR family transcriptional regulator, partial [Spirochaetaceae bacterium]
MPKGFTEREKELIRKKLYTEGTRLFGQYGVQKTTVDEIAKAAGISKGSFYGFYDSKEELFF